MNETEDGAQPEDMPPAHEDAGGSGNAAAPARRFDWETCIRCVFLISVVSFLGFLSWRPGLVRLNMLTSLIAPSRGESLVWKPENDPQGLPPEIKRTKPPGEWRLTSAFSADWRANRPAAKTVDARPGSLSHIAWRRFSDNPWLWRDDAAPRGSSRVEDADDSLPPQKSTSSVRVGNIASFPLPVPSEAIPDFPGVRPDAAALPASPQPPSPNFGAAEFSPSLPPLPVIPNPAPDSAPQPIDWKNREITGPIPDAYLTIYPKLKFIGLCVPGQGYVRKYNQVGVPADMNNPKTSAQDGRTPYGRYYIADRNRDADGARLYLSWPSPDDADRAGLPPQDKSAIEAAWRRQGLPPQNTRAGGGIAINGLRQWVETTEGGFTLEEPHMEEVFTALPDKAWIFIQP